ncbi:MAG: putative bifunctional diguanylate cyclase/phosphodiesterase [Motilibacteraceae bacterium]
MTAPGVPDATWASGVLDALGLAVVVTDLTGTVTYWNGAAEQLYGWPAAEAVGRGIDELTVPEVTAEVSEEIMASLSAGGSWTGQFPCRRSDGSTFLALVSDSPVRDVDGRQVGIVGISADLGQALAPLLTRSADTAIVFNADRTVRYTSPGQVAMLGFSDSELVGRNLRSLVHPEDMARLEPFSAQLVGAPGPQPPVEMRLRTVDGDWRWVEMAATNLLHDPVIHGFVANLRDITSRRQAQDELAHLALHDPLTGLANRTLVMDRIQHVLEHAERTGRAAGTVLFVDLDAFKDVNDAVGHLGGDEMLREIAARLRAVVRADDTCARLGGDEFLVVAESSVHEADALVLAERVHAALRRPIRLGDVDVLPAASIGVTSIRPGQPDAHAVVREADVAMYRAKSRGPGRTELHHPGDEEDRGGALRTVGELRQALGRHELLVHYQPIVDLDSGEVRGAEALVRWLHPEHGLLAPDTFIPLAERSGLIVPLGAWVLREACRYAVDVEMPRRRQGISVNLSPLQLEDDGLVQTVLETLRESGLPPESLVLEVTEGTLLNEGERASRALAALREAGVRVAIDDFGTGYAGFAYLKRFPADTLKIDASFIRGLGTGDDPDEAIVGSLVHLAHGLKLRVVAEGVETDAQADRLRALGCELAQGFLFSPPRPPVQREPVEGVGAAPDGDERQGRAYRVP